MYSITSTRKEGSGDFCTVIVFSRGICEDPMRIDMSHDAASYQPQERSVIVKGGQVVVENLINKTAPGIVQLVMRLEKGYTRVPAC